jgi:hypothetical protein
LEPSSTGRVVSQPKTDPSKAAASLSVTPVSWESPNGSTEATPVAHEPEAALEEPSSPTTAADTTVDEGLAAMAEPNRDWGQAPENPMTAGSGQSETHSDLATDLELRRQSFLPNRGPQSAADAATEDDRDPSNMVEAPVPGDANELPETETDQISEGDGSGSYWDTSTRVVPRRREFGVDLKPLDDPDASYWNKSRRRD